MYKSFGILRTNVGLTTNVKIMVDSNYKLSLDSIESDVNLSYSKYKNVKFTKDNFYDELIPYFWKGLATELSYSIKYDNDVDTMSDNFANQYDELYQYGARNIIDNKNYTEEYEYFAPLYLTKKLPKSFIIFRVDGPGVISLNKSNFIFEIINKLKTVKIFDLTKYSDLGYWLDRNFISNRYFPESPLDIDFRSLEFCRWNGIDYDNGGYTNKSLFIDDILDEEKEIYELEKFVFDSYKNNKVVFPNILNLSFLFDDTPSTPDYARKWSINRYYGFYLDDLELVTTISPYQPVPLHSDIQILEGNILYSPTSQNPFLQEWSDKRPFYIEYNGNYYIVEQFQETLTNQLVKNVNQISKDQRLQRDLGFESKNNRNQSVIKKAVKTNTKSSIEEVSDVNITRYRVISDISLVGLTYSNINQNYGIVNDLNQIVTYDLENEIPLVIDNFSDADVWLIEIDGIYHNIVLSDGYLKLSTDYSFDFIKNSFTYKVGGVSKTVTTVVDFNNKPIKFSIYKLNFSDIKDFDTRIVDTEYSKYEYEKLLDLTLTDETKMYVENIRSQSSPIDLDDFRYKNEVVNIPASSEYTANYETFKIDGGELSSIWRKNSNYCRWGFNKSLSANDMPYLLNNSLLFEDFNRTVNPFELSPMRSERNLDYFYSINSNSSSYLYHSLHIENYVAGLFDTNFTFRLDNYLNFNNYEYDYFTYLFGKSNYFLDGKIKKYTNKWSYFNVGDESVPNHTLFKGIRFNIQEVSSLVLDENGKINKLNVKSSNLFEDYKFSILLSDDNSNFVYNTAISNKIIGVTTSTNIFDWLIIDNWRMNISYKQGDLVLYDDVVFIALRSIAANTQASPSTGWTISSTHSKFWSPNTIYSNNDWIYSGGEYWYLSASSSTGRPNNSVFGTNSQFNIDYNWDLIKNWNGTYSINEYAIKDDTLYISTTSTTNLDVPGVSNKWIATYSVLPKPNKQYNPGDIVYLNDKYYYSSGKNKLQDGIIIYINKKWKNILININVNDGTYQTTNINRDDIYTEIYSKLTAANFIRCLNDISNKYGFSDYLSYVIIEEDGTRMRYSYDMDITNLPYLITCDLPDQLDVKVDSLFKRAVELPNNLNPNKKLKDGLITNINELNYYNDIPVAANIIENKFEPKVFEIYHGNKNITKNTLWRFSGYYSPVFYDIQLFSRDYKDISRPYSGNYKFDIDLTDFGIMKERKIRKINRKGSILRLSSVEDEKSIYPMLDEFGYSIYDFFIFSSTWDLKYYLETTSLSIPKNYLDKYVNTENVINTFNESINRTIVIPTDIGQTNN
jgi:hypothetical protein